MNQETNPLKYLPLIGMGIFVVFWGASQAVQVYMSGQHAQSSVSRSTINASTLPNPMSPPASSCRMVSTVFVFEAPTSTSGAREAGCGFTSTRS